MLYLDPPQSLSLAWRLFYPIILLGSVAYGSWYSFRQKFVSADQKALRVSGLFSRCEMPLSNVDRVDESMLMCVVIVRLKSPSVFGRTIWFTPTWPGLLFFGPHPVTQELRELVRHASAVDAV
jgi:hypothetical protein